MKIMWTYIVAGLTIFGLMLLVGIGLRASQAGWIPIDTGTFYSLLSLHGVGMITAMAIAGLGLLWYLVDRDLHLDERVAMLAFAFFAIGVLVVDRQRRFRPLRRALDDALPASFRGNHLALVGDRSVVARRCRGHARLHADLRANSRRDLA